MQVMIANISRIIKNIDQSQYSKLATAYTSMMRVHIEKSQSFFDFIGLTFSSGKADHITNKIAHMIQIINMGSNIGELVN